MKNKPTYSIGSVDHALHLAQLLQQEGPLRVTDAAELLGVSRSTAHRLLAMLVYRDFAEQVDDRSYQAGPALRSTATSKAPLALLRRLAQPHLQKLMERVGETTNLMVLAGTEVRFVSTVECNQILRVGDREGQALPAHLASGGKTLLAALDEEELTRLYREPDESVDLEKLRSELALVRKRGFAINDQLTETGVTAVGGAVRRPDDEKPVAALSIAAPTARFDRHLLPSWVATLSETAAGLGRDLNAAAG
ncbi:IclR family transcriptional regulator [Streptomyces sioyaensis]|uniref:IclR family transcriptional regulator n=1 Tax=Streptomyces sioyaensis TaxID=67364 RepID=UPI003D705299